MKLSEKHIQETCSAFLELDGWRRLRTEPVSDRGRGTGFGELGMCDDLFIRYEGFTVPPGTTERLLAAHAEGHVCIHATISANVMSVKALSQVLWVEWKALRGKTATHQKAWHAAERARGALVVVAHQDFKASIEGFAAWYIQSRLQRNMSLKIGAG
jgi:hypothetical protein